jgi:hypothetical protein
MSHNDAGDKVWRGSREKAGRAAADRRYIYEGGRFRYDVVPAPEADDDRE